MATQTYDIEWIREEYRKLPPESPVRTTAPLSAQRLEKLKEKALQPPRAIPTPWPQLSAAFRGPGGGIGIPLRSTTILAGAPGFGKSLAGLAFARAAMAAGHNVALINLEMDEDETVCRLLAQTAKIPVHVLEPGPGFRSDLWDRAAQKLLELPGTLWLNPEPSLFSLQDILVSIEVLAVRFNVKLFVVDYIQLVRVKGAVDRRDEVETAAREISQAVKRLDAAALLLAQLKRDAVAGDRTPGMADVQWSSALEQDARAVLILDHSRLQRDVVYRQVDRFALHVAKMRAGYTCDVVLDFDRINLTLEEAPRGLVWEKAARCWIEDYQAKCQEVSMRYAESQPLDEGLDSKLPF